MSSFLDLSQFWTFFRLATLLIVLGGFGAAGLTVYWLLRYVASGDGTLEIDQVFERSRGFLVYVIGQKRVIAEPAGILHLFVFWGFLGCVSGRFLNTEKRRGTELGIETGIVIETDIATATATSLILPAASGFAGFLCRIVHFVRLFFLWR